MAWFIIYFDEDGKVIDVSRFAESEFDSYQDSLELAIERQEKIQYGYF